MNIFFFMMKDYQKIIVAQSIFIVFTKSSQLLQHLINKKIFDTS